MPFKKVAKNDYTSPSGRHFNSAQVKLYYAGGGKFPGEKGKGEMKYAKGGDIRETSYAAGGPVTGRVREFMKEPDAFRTDSGPGARQEYGGKAGEKAADKSLKPIKPRA